MGVGSGYSYMYTVEPLYYGHHWYNMIKHRCLFQRWSCTLLYVAGTAGSVLIREVSFISEVLNREVPL